MSRLLPHVTFLCLAPIVGAEEANAFIERKLSEPPPELDARHRE